MRLRGGQLERTPSGEAGLPNENSLPHVGRTRSTGSKNGTWIGNHRPGSFPPPPIEPKDFTAAQKRCLEDIAKSRELKHVDVRIALLIIFRMDRKKGFSFPGLRKLQEESGCSRSTVQRSIERLVTGGWLFRVSGTGHLASRYGLDWPRWVPPKRSGSLSSPDPRQVPFLSQ